MGAEEFEYQWDEVGRLAEAARWDLPTGTAPPTDGIPPGAVLGAKLRHACDAGDQRVLKTAIASDGAERHTVYVFESLELRRAAYGVFGSVDDADYELSKTTEVPYLFANGVRLARVAWEDLDVPSIGQTHLHVLFELGDHLGSTSVVLDKATSELVERSTFQAYGAAESDYRPARWAGFREDYRFTGKEEDVEVGLQYFGKRYYAPLLNRWVSADPLAVHGLGGDPTLYAYVRGVVLAAVDPLGLADTAQDAAYEYVRANATPGDARSSALPAASYPLNRAGRGTGSSAVDHMISVKDISSRKDFQQLTLEQQIDVVQTRENLALLDPKVNSAKGRLSASEYAAKIGLGDNVVAELKYLEQRAQTAIDRKITDYQSYNKMNKVDVRQFDAEYVRSRHGRPGGFNSSIAERLYEGITTGVWRLRGETSQAARLRLKPPQADTKTGRVRIRGGRWLLGVTLDIVGAYFLKLDKNERDSVHRELKQGADVVKTGDRVYVRGDPDST